ncbi:hypothetical protein [uncultured Metabacillus sp.]|uniref:hypothetical protein n=1 Tax=uncultured Metabacillus sp. TaxID=2860135 RepID=UPI002621FD04|nr:hypothetical protein [uncultured Metabacillus sp.]
MKQISLEIQDQYGETIKQETITINNGDKIIMQAKEDIPLDTVKLIHESVRHALTDESIELVTLANSFEIKVLKVK